MFRVGDLVQFNTIQDDSCMASDCFGFDPSCGSDWFDIQVHVESFYGEIVKRGIIEVIYTNGKRSGKFYKIYKGSIKGETKKLLEIKKARGLTLKQIFDVSAIKTLKEFAIIEKIDRIPMTKLYVRKKCFDCNPPTDKKLNIWKPHGNIGYQYICQTVYNGKWEIEIEGDYAWEVSLERFYINGKVYVEEC